jgi:uncharacterized membrane protein YidH (DUF202 family)
VSAPFEPSPFEPSPFEPSPTVPNERTALAWQRTALALLAGSAIVARLTVDRIGVLAVLSLVVVLPLATWVMVESRGRYAHDAGVRQRQRPRGGRAPFVLAAATMLIALTELAALVASL